ncbi:MDR family MFS transporter [Cryptosporangium sp. NPDC051539]|uniref:MDR family MFS transporter n=1 Tax=Cryptosporangium sp. NPDC051539 TaxID=3363962 RepID=UPI003794FFBB
MMLSTALIAIDSTVLATAVPSIVDDVGGFSAFPWLFSVYLLAQAVTVPLCGKLADLFGRKPIMLAGIGLFLLGSILCGLAWSMGALIAFRVVQGLGAGAIAPMTTTIAGDIYTTEERAKAQGYIAGMWGVASVVGPALGGVFSEYTSWRWIFLVNVPLCLIAAGMVLRNFTERVERSRPAVDYTGAALLTGGLTLLILALLEGGQRWAWASPAGVGAVVVGVALLVGFLVVERRAEEPVLPLWVFRRRLLVSSGAASAAIGAVVFGLTSYIPTYVQDVLGAGPLVAGFALATLSFGWPIAASQSGRIYLRVGFRVCAVIGTSIALAGTLLLLLLNEHTSVWQVAGTCLFIGVGMGLTNSPTLIAAQSSVGWHERGVVTANNLFMRSVGSAVGIAVFGAIANAVLGDGPRTPEKVTDAVQHIVVVIVGLSVVLLLAAIALPRTPRASEVTG